jgi:hypothetical protein
MKLRIIVVAGATLAINLMLPLAARADQAILSHDALFVLRPGESVEHSDTLVLSRFGIPTVVFTGTSGFADNETVVATIALSLQNIDDLGTVELLSSSTLTGTTTAAWTSDPPDPAASEFTFDPPISLRYTAPSAVELDCAGHPGKTFRTHLGVAATLVGSAGTTASFSADDFPGVVMFDVTCPAAVAPPSEAPSAPHPTLPPTDAEAVSPSDPNGTPIPPWFAIACPVIAAVIAATFSRRPSADRSRRPAR